MHTWRFFQSIHFVHVCSQIYFKYINTRHATQFQSTFNAVWLALNSIFECIIFEWNETKKTAHTQSHQRKSIVIQVHFSNRNHEFPINSLATNWRTAVFFSVSLNFSGQYSCYQISFCFCVCKYNWKWGTHYDYLS